MKLHQSQICDKLSHAVSELSKSISAEGPLEQRKVTLESKGAAQGSASAGRQHPEGPIKYHLEVASAA